MQAKSC